MAISMLTSLSLRLPFSIFLQAFAAALIIKEVSDNDDFFVMGGNSVTAAHAAYNLGIDMRLIYCFPTPLKLQTSLLQRTISCNNDVNADSDYKVNENEDEGNKSHSYRFSNFDFLEQDLRTNYENNENHTAMSKRLKVGSDKHRALKLGYMDGSPWSTKFSSTSCSFSRCNKNFYGLGNRGNDQCEVTWSLEGFEDRKGFLQELWKVNMESCVDASPLLVVKDSNIYIFVGSHSHKFLCIDAKR